MKYRGCILPIALFGITSCSFFWTEAVKDVEVMANDAQLLEDAERVAKDIAKDCF